MSRRILFVIDSYQPAGRALQLDLVTQALSQDFDVHIACLDVEESPPRLTTANDNRTFHFLGKQERRTLDSPNSATVQITLVGRLRKLVGRLRPAVVHTWGQPTERVSLLACRRLRFETPRIISTELSLRPEKRFSLQLLDRRLSRNAERMIVPHESVKESLVEAGYRGPRITIAPNAIAVGAKRNAPYKSTVIDEKAKTAARQKLKQLCRLPDDFKLGGAVAPLHARSRLKDLVWATDLLTCIRNDFHFVIFGVGPQLQRLKKFASQTEAFHHVHFVGEPENTLELVSGLDFFMQSHLNDPQPAMLLHAMSRGVPAISVYGPGTTEIIRHQETGFAVNYGARDEFARWTKYMLELPDAAKQLAKQGQQFVQRQFPVEKTIQTYREIYDIGF